MIKSFSKRLAEQQEVKIDFIDDEQLFNVSQSVNYNEFSVQTDTNIIYKKGYSPFINSDTDTWWEYDDTIGGFIDTYVVAKLDMEPISTNFIESYWYRKEIE